MIAKFLVSLAEGTEAAGRGSIFGNLATPQFGARMDTRDRTRNNGRTASGREASAARDLRNFEVAETAVFFTLGRVAVRPPFRMLEFRSKGSAVRDSRNSEAAEVAVQWLSGRQEHASRDGAWYEGPAISDARRAVLFSGH